MLQRRVKWSGCGCALGGEEENGRVGSEQVAVHHPSLVRAQLCSGLRAAQAAQSLGPLGKL